MIEKAGIDHVGFGLPLADWQLDLFNLPPASTVLKLLPSLIKTVKNKTGCGIVFDLVDATRTSIDILIQAVEIGIESGVELVILYDTVGAVFPNVFKYLVRTVKEITSSIPVGVHVHDDFGLATASICAGIEAGAEYADLVVNKLGDRAGNASLEETAVALELLYGVKTGLRLEKLFPLSKLVERISGVALPKNKPIVGFNTFLYESELHVLSVQDPDKWRCFMPFHPKIVGRKANIIYGQPRYMATPSKPGRKL